MAKNTYAVGTLQWSIQQSIDFYVSQAKIQNRKYERKCATIRRMLKKREAELERKKQTKSRVIKLRCIRAYLADLAVMERHQETLAYLGMACIPKSDYEGFDKWFNGIFYDYETLKEKHSKWRAETKLCDKN